MDGNFRKTYIFDMEERTVQQKNLRTLSIVLIFSGALNISLIVAGVFSAVKDRKISYATTSSLFKEMKPESTNSQVVESFSKLGFRELVSYLTNRDLVEEGYTKRDLALAALVANHHFNLGKALGAFPEQKRNFQLANGTTLAVFPGLKEEQYEAIIRFAYQEKWPLTAEGIFRLLSKWPKPRDPTLEQAFSVTTEFHALQTLFQKTEALQSASTLLDLVCEGSWDLLNCFSHEQEQMLDLSVDKRRRLLLSYLAFQSPVAAQLLLVTDFAFALKRLEDPGICALLKLLNQTPEAVRFCRELLSSLRSDTVLQAAATKLSFFTEEPVAVPARQPVDPMPKPVAVEKKPDRFHVVKEGESLWKIARTYKVPLDEIVKLNGLDKDKLYPGMSLKIPQGTGSEPPR